MSDGDRVIDSKELDGGYTHAENLHVFIEELIKRNSLSYRDLKAVAVSRGPGSYTGLRIGVSAAKGFCFALNIPLLSVDTLKLVAAASGVTEGHAVLCPMIDARRMEVYMSLYDTSLNRLQDVEAFVVSPASIERFRANSNIYFIGNGMEKCRNTLSTLPGAKFLDGIKTSARYMAPFSSLAFSEKKFEDVAYFEPYYLKEFVSGDGLKRQ